MRGVAWRMDGFSGREIWRRELMLQPGPWRDLAATTPVRAGRKAWHGGSNGSGFELFEHGSLGMVPMSIYTGPCPPLGTSCSTCLIVTNRSHTSHCITTISYYQTRLGRSLLTPSRDTYTYRRSLPIYQSRNTIELKENSKGK